MYLICNRRATAMDMTVHASKCCACFEMLCMLYMGHETAPAPMYSNGHVHVPDMLCMLYMGHETAPAPMYSNGYVHVPDM